MAENKNIEVGGRLHSIATGNVLAGANEIFDDSKNKKQSDINTETYSLVNDVNERLSGLSPDQQSALSVAAKATNNETKLGYYVCDTEGNLAAKVISDATGYILSKGGSIKIKMTNANTANNATLNINSTGAKALYYDGIRATSNNSWEAGETVEVYYDGTSYYANNVAGGSSDGVFDVSIKYPTSGVEGGNTYTLEGALSVLNTNLPASKKKGGMSIKFVQSSDNKYIQARCMAQNFTTDVTQWQGVDTSPKAGSKNLAESGGIWLKYTTRPTNVVLDRAFYSDGSTRTLSGWLITDYIDVSAIATLLVNYGTTPSNIYVIGYNESKVKVDSWSYQSAERTINVPSTCEYMRFSFYYLSNTWFAKNNANGDIVFNTDSIEAKTIREFQKNIEDTFAETNEKIFNTCLKTDHSKYYHLLGSTNKIINSSGTETGKADWFVTRIIPATAGNKIVWNICATDDSACLCAYNSGGTKLDNYVASAVQRTITLPANTAYIRASFPVGYKDDIYLFDETSNTFLFAYPFVADDMNSVNKGNFTSVLKTGTVNTPISEFDKENAIQYFDESFIGKGLYSTGSVQTNTAGFVCGFIPVSAGDVVEWNAGTGLTGHNNCCVYKSDKTFKDNYAYDSSGKRTLTMPSDAAYIMATFAIEHKDSAYLKVNGVYVFAYPYVFDKLTAKTNKSEIQENAYIDILSRCTYNAYITSGGGIGYVDDKFVSPKIPAVTNDVIYWEHKMTGSTDGYLCAYDSNGNLIDFYGHTDSARTITLTRANIAYIRATFNYAERKKCLLKVNDVTMLKFVDSFEWINNFSLNEPHRMRVALWNVGMFQDGASTTPAGVPDANMDTVLPQLKSIFTKINADILVLEEYNEYINKGDSGVTRLLTYDTLLKQFYPYYRPKNNLGIAIFSKVEIPFYKFSSESEPNRPMRIGSFRLGCQTIDICACHTWGGDTPNQDIVDKMAGKKNVIIVGDLNTYLSSYLNPFRNDGYTLGNWGYWGELITNASDNHGLDNIIVKGLQLDNFQVIQEHTASDHNPVMADVSIVI